MQREQTGSSSSILEPSDIYKTRNPNSSFLTLCSQQQLAKPLSFVHAQYIVPTRSETTYQYAIAKRLVTPFTPCEGCNDLQLRRLLRPIVSIQFNSIHAPARGATLCPTTHDYRRNVSIHAPTRGATSSGRLTCSEGEVSIHAPARGATVCAY